jgi:hypothetical protein
MHRHGAGRGISWAVSTPWQLPCTSSVEPLCACMQVRSHAQKFFLKLEKCGKANVVPPPRPKKRAAKPYPVQDRSEERRKSKRSRPSNSNSSGQSVPSHNSPSCSPMTTQTRTSPRSAATAVTSLLTSSRPLRSARLARSSIPSKGSSQDLEGALSHSQNQTFLPRHAGHFHQLT